MRELLIVVDFQADFVDGPLGFPGAMSLDWPIAARIDAYRAAGGDVAFTYDTHSADYLNTREGRELPVVHCVESTPGWELYGETGRRVRAEDWLFQKPTFPSFALARWLCGQDYGKVELCGLVSHMCVLSNAVMVQSVLPEAEIVVDEHLTDSYDPGLHEKAIDLLEGLHVTVIRRKGAAQ